LSGIKRPKQVENQYPTFVTVAKENQTKEASDI